MNIAKMPHNVIKALLLIAPKKDVRLYLNAICIDFDKQLAVATDGAALMVVKIGCEGSGQAILDRPDAEKIVKKCKPRESIWFEHDPDAKTIEVKSANVNGTLKAVDARFPEYERVIETKFVEGSPQRFNPELLDRIQRAYRLVTGSKGAVVRLAPSEHDNRAAAAVVWNCVEAMAVVMPINVAGKHAWDVADYAMDVRRGLFNPADSESGEDLL